MFIRKNLVCVDQKISVKQGFTLIELLMAIGIFVLGSVSVWTLYFSAVESHKQAIDEQQIAWLANALLSELKKTDITTQSTLKPIQQKKLGYFSEYTYNIDFIDLGNSAVGVTIQIYYQRKGQLRSHSFQTVVYRTLPPK